MYLRQKNIVLRILLLALAFNFLNNVEAQPFRYVAGTKEQRDSIKLFGIKGYREYSSSHEDSAKIILTGIIEYDTNGNMIRNFRHDFTAGWETQYTWKYDEQNREIESASFSPDSNTYLQRFYNCYDSKGNKTEYIVENYSGGVFVGNSRTVNEYDTAGHLISLKVYSKEGLHTHYEYRYHPKGYRIEELVYSPDGKLLWRRPSSDYYEEERLPYGFPMEKDPEMEELLKVTTSFDSKTGNTTYTDGYGIRVFNSKGLLIYWYERYFRHHWYEYSFYH